MAINKDNFPVKRAEIVMVDLGAPKGSIQGGVRPAVVTDNDDCCRYSKAIHVSPCTGSTTKANLETHVELIHSGLSKSSVILVEQDTLIQKSQIIRRIGMVDKDTMDKVDNALLIQKGLKSTQEELSVSRLMTYKSNVETFYKAESLTTDNIFRKELSQMLDQNLKLLENYCKKFKIELNFINGEITFTYHSL